MLILIEGYGRLANRLIQYAHFIAFCKENDIAIYNLPFIDYANYFKGSVYQIVPYFKKDYESGHNKRSNIMKFLLHFINFLFKLFFKIIKIRKPIFIKNIGFLDFDSTQLSKEEFLEKAKNIKYLFVKGWNFRDFDNVKKNYDTIIKYFEILDIYKKEVDSFINPLREKYKNLVAVHIRRTDYKTESPQFYFSDQVYCKYLLQLKELFKDNTLFIIFSDEKIDIEYYKNHNLEVIQSDKSFIVDLYSMACCDYIIGVGSTFNIWAAFYGKKRHREIKGENEKIELSDFKIIETL